MPSNCKTCGSPLLESSLEGLCTRCVIGNVLDPPPFAGDEWAEFDDPQPPREFGGYQLLGEIARGGMGVVYRARQERPDRVLAIKIISGGELASPRMVERFHAEASASARLDHPNIVPIYEVGRHAGYHFFSMRYVEGKTLAAVLATGPRPGRQAARLLATVARAVHHAHQRGILHRDIKPGNILLDANGVPHLTDFGLAKILEDDPGLTRSGVMLGTPGYMPPEQAEGRMKEVTTASDVYSLGAVLYEMITGRPPFVGDSVIEVARRVVETEPTHPATLNPAAPKDLATIALKCLQKDGARRYGSAEALAEDLERWLRHEPITARPVPTWEMIIKWTKRNPARTTAIVTLVITLAAIIWGAIAFSLRLARERDIASQFQRIAERESAEHHRQLVRAQLETGEQLLRDGDLNRAQLRFAEAIRLEQGDPVREGPLRYLVESVRRTSPDLSRLWFQPAGAEVLAFAPADRWLLAAPHLGALDLKDLKEGKAPRSIPQFAAGLVSAEFDPAGSRLVTLDANGLVQIWDVASGALLVTAQQPSGFSGEAPSRGARIRFSPDGQALLSTGIQGEVVLWNAATGHLLHRFLTGTNVVSARFSPNGEWIGVSSTDNTVHLWRTDSGEKLSHVFDHDQAVYDSPLFHPRTGALLTYHPRSRVFQFWDFVHRIPNGPARPAENVVGAAISPDGATLAANIWGGNLPVWHLEEGNVAPDFYLPNERSREVLFSPDGRRLMAAGFNKTIRVWDLATGRPALPALSHSSHVMLAAWSRDGEAIATSCQDGTLRLWQLYPPAGRVVSLIEGVTVRQTSLDHRRQHLLAECSDGTARVWDLSVDPPRLTELRHGEVLEATAISPSGEFAATAGGSDHLRIWDLRPSPPTFQPVEVNQTAQFLAFSPRGDRLAIGNTNGAVEIVTIRTDHSKSTPLLIPGIITSFGVGSDELLAIGTKAGEIHVVSLATGEVGRVFRQPGEIARVRFSPDGTRLVAASWSGSLEALAAHVWELASGHPAVPPLAHTDGLTHAEFSPNGRVIVTTSEDDCATLWDSATGRRIAAPLTHSAGVVDAAFSPVGRRIVTGGIDRTARIWDAGTGVALSPPLEHRGVIMSVGFGVDGDTVFAAGEGGLSYWRLPKSGSSVEEIVARAQALSGSRIDEMGGVSPLELSELAAAWNRAAKVK